MASGRLGKVAANQLCNLHEEVLYECFSFLPAESLCRLMASCTALKRECSKNELWKELCRAKGVIDGTFVDNQNYCSGPSWKYIYSSLNKIITTGWQCHRWEELLSRIWMLKESSHVREAIRDGYTCVCREVELEAVPDHFGNNLASTRTRFAMLGDAWTLHMEGAEGYFGRELSFWLSREPPQSEGSTAVADVGDSSWYHVIQLRHCVAVRGEVLSSDAGQDRTSYELGHVPFKVFAQLPVGRPDDLELRDEYAEALVQEHHRAGGEGPESLHCGDGLGWELDAAVHDQLEDCIPAGEHQRGRAPFLLLLFVRSLFSHTNPPSPSSLPSLAPPPLYCHSSTSQPVVEPSSEHYAVA